MPPVRKSDIAAARKRRTAGYAGGAQVPNIYEVERGTD